MKIDWCKDTGKWNVWDIQTGVLLAKVECLYLQAPAEFITTDGGRHGYAVTCGTLELSGSNATIRSNKNGNR